MTNLTQDILVELVKMTDIFVQEKEYETILDFVRCCPPESIAFYDDGNHKILYNSDDWETCVGTEYNHEKGERVVIEADEILSILYDEETDE